MDNEPTLQTHDRRTIRRDPGRERFWRPFFDFLRWIGDHVRGFYGALGVFFLIGLALSLVPILIFAGIATLMAAGATQRMDDRILLWMDRHAQPWLDVWALEVTALGSSVVIVMTVVIASAFLWATRHHYSAILLWVAMIGGGILNSALKNLFDRPRPELFEWRTDYVGGMSFPSGHSMSAVVVYGTLAYLVMRLEPTRGLRRFTLAVFAIVIVAIGLSRMYLGVHYPSDVLAGFVAGLAWAAFCALGIEAVRYFRTRKPEVVIEEKDLEVGTRRIQETLDDEPSAPADRPTAPN